MCVSILSCCARAELAGIGPAMRDAINNGQIAGAVTVVVTKDKALHCEAAGFADIASKQPMQPDSLFWIVQ